MICKRDAERRINSAISAELRNAAINNLLINNKCDRDYLKGWISTLLILLFSSLVFNAVLIDRILEAL